MGTRGGNGGGSGDGVLLVRMGYEDCPIMGGERVALEDLHWSLLSSQRKLRSSSRSTSLLIVGACGGCTGPAS